MTLYEALGGEPVLQKLVDAFYTAMEQMPEARVVREMHHQDLSSANRKLFMFLSGWLGGPPLFVEAFGHPRLRARHLPFKIGKAERDQWMLCMVKAFDDCQIQDPVRSELLYSLLNLADHMRNQTDDGQNDV